MRLTLSLLTLLVSASVAIAQEKPNILYIFADDYAYDCVHALGNSEIQTPHLDQLVECGLTFTNTYNMGGYHGAVCVASRQMLLTGRYLWNVQSEEKSIRPYYQGQSLLWPQLLAKQGYDTYFTGKWHVQADAEKAFKVARHVRPGMPNQTDEGYHRPKETEPDVWKPWDTSREGFWKGGKHWSEVVADDATEYLNIAKTSSNPFFMYIAFNAPHDPRQSPKSYVDRYPADALSLPKPFLPEYPFDIGIKTIRDEVLGPYPRTPHVVQVHRQEYYAIITHLDDQIGRILEALKATGKANNTYIVFTADHGLACGHHGLLGKQNMFEHSMRVPFMICGPKIPGNVKRDARIYLQDIMPTTLGWAGATVPGHVQFHSLQPLIDDPQAKGRETIYGAYTNTQRMVVDGDFKLIRYPKIDRTLLFNLREDPTEATDLAELPEHKERITAMMEKLRAWQPVTGDKLAL